MVNLGGRDRRLRFDANALAAVEEVLGKPLHELFPAGEEGAAAKQLGFREMRALLWAGLLHEEERLNLRQAGELLDLERLEEIMGRVTEAVELAFPQTQLQGEPEKNGDPPAAGTGESS